VNVLCFGTMLGADFLQSQTWISECDQGWLGPGVGGRGRGRGRSLSPRSEAVLLLRLFQRLSLTVHSTEKSAVTLLLNRGWQGRECGQD
jgi:hypothetical protein